MKIKRRIPLFILILVLILELLPYGAVLNFANPEGEPWRQTFSYFSFTPFGYANFGPFITALLTSALTILSLIYLVKPNDKITSTCKVISVLTILVSLAPLMFGLRSYSLIGGAISALLFTECVMLYRIR